MRLLESFFGRLQGVRGRERHFLRALARVLHLAVELVRALPDGHEAGHAARDVLERCAPRHSQSRIEFWCNRSTLERLSSPDDLRLPALKFDVLVQYRVKRVMNEQNSER